MFRPNQVRSLTADTNTAVTTENIEWCDHLDLEELMKNFPGFGFRSTKGAPEYCPWRGTRHGRYYWYFNPSHTRAFSTVFPVTKGPWSQWPFAIAAAVGVTRTYPPCSGATEFRMYAPTSSDGKIQFPACFVLPKHAAWRLPLRIWECMGIVHERLNQGAGSVRWADPLVEYFTKEIPDLSMKEEDAAPRISDMFALRGPYVTVPTGKCPPNMSNRDAPVSWRKAPVCIIHPFNYIEVPRKAWTPWRKEQVTRVLNYLGIGGENGWQFKDDSAALLWRGKPMNDTPKGGAHSFILAPDGRIIPRLGDAHPVWYPYTIQH